MQNPFTTTFSKTPEYTYIHTEKTEEILENFIYDNPSESVYKITGVRGSGKTVILAKVEEELRTNESRYINWLVFDVNPARDILGQIAAMLVKAGFGSQDKKTTGINLSATVMGTGGGIGYTAENNNNFFDIGVEVETMIQAAQKKGKKILIRMTEMYKSKLDIDSNEAREMAKITKGYAYAFQELGVLYFKKKLDELLEDILPKLKAELFAYSYEKIWEEMTEMDRFLAGLLTEKEEYKREEVLKLMGEKSGSYSMYRDRLIKRGILNSRQGYISLALPYFGEYIKEYC